MPSVKIKENEPVEGVLRKFKRLCEKAGRTNEFRKRDRYEKPKTVRKRKKAAAVKRAVKALLRDPVIAKKLKRGGDKSRSKRKPKS